MLHAVIDGGQTRGGRWQGGGLRAYGLGFGFGVWGLGLRVWGLGFGVQGLGLRVWG